MIRLNSFIENLGNIVRPNRFLVTVSPPSIITSSMDTLSYYAQSTSIPERSFGEIEFKYYGMTLKVPGHEISSDLNITFIADEKWEVRNLFETWANKINDRNNSSKEYMSTLFTNTSITVSQLGRTGNILTSYVFYNAFPKTVGEIALSMETNDSFETFDVTFGFSYFLQKNQESNVNYTGNPALTNLGVTDTNFDTGGTNNTSPVNNSTNYTGNPALTNLGITRSDF